METVGGGGGEGVTPSCDLKPPWPVLAKGRAFESFLDELGIWLHTEPPVASNCNDFDITITKCDNDNYNNIKTSNIQFTKQDIFLQLIMNKQANLKGVVTLDSICGFEEYNRFSVLESIARVGVQAHT